MHIDQVMTAAHYRMVEGRDWLWDFQGKDCREVLFESWGLHDSNEHFPVSAVFHCDSGAVRQLTVETKDGAWRWMAQQCHAGYILACADLGEQPWQEQGLTWVSDAAEILGMIAAALNPDRRPDDADESYRWSSSGDWVVERDSGTGWVNVNPD